MRTKQQIEEELEAKRRRLIYLGENEWDSGVNGPTKEVKEEYKRVFKEWKTLLKEHDSLP